MDAGGVNGPRRTANEEMSFDLCTLCFVVSAKYNFQTQSTKYQAQSTVLPYESPRQSFPGSEISNG